MSGITITGSVTIDRGVTIGSYTPPIGAIGYIDIFGNGFSNPAPVISRQNSLVYDSSNNLYAVGYIDNGSYNSGTISKYDIYGAIQWQRKLGASSPSYTNFLAVDVDSSGNVYVTGSTSSNSSTDNNDIQLVKYDTNGTLQWQKTLGSSGRYQSGLGIVVEKNTGNFYVGGNFFPNAGSQDFRMLIAKYDTSGTLLWQQSLTPVTSSDQSVCQDIALDSAGNVYAVGSAPTGATYGQGVLVKYDSSGSFQWQVAITKATGQSGYNAITIDSSNNIYVCGDALTASGGTSYGIVAKYSTSGALQWKKQIGDGSGHPYLSDITVDSLGNVYSTGIGGPSNSSYIVKLDSSGNLTWQRLISASTYWAYMFSITIDSADNIVAGGHTRDPGAGVNQILMLKVPSDGSPTGTYTANGISFTYGTPSLPIADLSAWSTTTTTLTDGTTSFATATSTLPNTTTSFANDVTPIPGGTPGVDNVTGYSEMNPPIIPGNQLEDGSATINGTTGFTINDSIATGVAIPGLTSSNVNWFAVNYPTVPGYYNVTWGAGSTVASSSIYVVQKPSSWPGGPLVFFIQGQTGAATYNFPFTFSV